MATIMGVVDGWNYVVIHCCSIIRFGMIASHDVSLASLSPLVPLIHLDTLTGECDRVSETQEKETRRKTA